jgi:hypothetical protein
VCSALLRITDDGIGIPPFHAMPSATSKAVRALTPKHADPAVTRAWVRGPYGGATQPGASYLLIYRDSGVAD